MSSERFLLRPRFTHSVRWSLRLTVFLTLVFSATNPIPAQQPAVAERISPELELLVLTDQGPVRLQLMVEVNEREVSAIWEETFDCMISFFDRDKDGVLDRQEAERLPNEFEVRQVLWRGIDLGTGAPPSWDALDQDRDESANRKEVAAYYRRSGLGGVLVGVGRPPHTAALTASLETHLDTDGNGRLSAEEWQCAAGLMEKLDANNDDLISPGELVPNITYPGASGSTLLLPPQPEQKTLPVIEELPLLHMPSDLQDTFWATRLIGRWDQNGDTRLSLAESRLTTSRFQQLDTDRDQISSAELAGWRRLPVENAWCVRLGKREEKHRALERIRGDAVRNEPEQRLSFAARMLCLELRIEPGQLPAKSKTTAKRFETLYSEADTNNDADLDAAELAITNYKQLGRLLKIADGNGDGRLSQNELQSWLALQKQITKSHVFLTVLDYQRGLFEWLDRDHDGSLSIPELATAWRRGRKADGVSNPAATRDKLPQTIIVAVSRGLPRSLLGNPIRTGPAWFRGMDRNRDGYLSRREFTGPENVFDRLETNQDGVLSPEEAGKLAK